MTKIQMCPLNVLNIVNEMSVLKKKHMSTSHTIRAHAKEC